MMYGTLLEKCVASPKGWNQYLRVVLCVETGFGLQTIRTNVFGKDGIEKVEAISLGSQIQFSGDYIKTLHLYYFKLLSLEAATFNSCEKCFAPLDGPCQGCLKEPTERITGEWKLVEREMINDSFKLTLTQDENVLCRYIFPNSPFYKACISLKEDETVKLQGRRDERRHTELSILEKSL